MKGNASLRQTIGTQGTNVVGAQCLDHGCAREARYNRDLRERKHDHRHDEVADVTIVKASDRQPVKRQRQQDLQQRTDDEIGDRQAKRCADHHRVIHGAVLAQRRECAQHHAKTKRQDQGQRAEQDRYRQAVAKQFGNGKIAHGKGWPEITAQERCQVVAILNDQRLVELVDAPQISEYLRIKRSLKVKRPARRQADQKE